MKEQILSKLEYRSDSTESATEISRMVWFPFIDLDLKEFKIIQHIALVVFSNDTETSSPALLHSLAP